MKSSMELAEKFFRTPSKKDHEIDLAELFDKIHDDAVEECTAIVEGYRIVRVPSVPRLKFTKSFINDELFEILQKLNKLKRGARK